MANITKILKNFNLFVDGRGYAGAVESVQLPSVEVVNEMYRGGGMDGSIALDMGISPMECQFTLSSFDYSSLSTWGLGEGNLIPVVIRGALEDVNGNTTALYARMLGTIRSVTPSEFTPAGKATLAFVMDVREYVLSIDDDQVYDIDVLNNKRVVNGVDRNAGINSAIGNSQNTITSDIKNFGAGINSSIRTARNTVNDIKNLFG